MAQKQLRGIEKLVKGIFIYLNPYQIHNTAGMIYSLIHASSPLVSQIARGFPYTKNYKPARKRIERFLRNRQCLFTPCHIQYLKWIIGFLPDQKRTSIIIDYTFLGRYMILWAAVPFKNRAIPIHFKVIANPLITHVKQKDRMIHLEIDFLRFLRIHLPQNRRWVIVADRGFGNQRNIGLCEKIGFDYVLRFKGDIRITARGSAHHLKNRKIKHLPQAKWRRGVLFKGLTVNLLSLTEGTDDPWYLITNLKNPNTVQKLYEQRFWIEEMFRDLKTHQEMKKTLIRSLNVTKRLCFLLQLSYSVVFFIGVLAKKSILVQKRILGSSKASFVFIALQVLSQLPKKFHVFLKKVIRNLRLNRAVLDTS